MKTLRLNEGDEEFAAQRKRKYGELTDVEEVIDRDTVLVKPDGHPVAVLLRERIDPASQRLAYELLKPVNGRLRNRAPAVGATSLPSPKKDGSLSERRGCHDRVLHVLDQQGLDMGYLVSRTIP